MDGGSAENAGAIFCHPCNSPLFCIHAAAAYSTSLYIKNGHKAHFKNSKKLKKTQKNYQQYSCQS